MMEDPEKAVIWFVVAILALLLLLALVGSVVVKFPVPSSQTNNIEKLSAVDNSLLLYYIGKLPVVTNATALTACNPQFLFISNGSGKPLLECMLNILKMNATQVSPGAYWTTANLAGFLQAKQNGNRSFLVAVTNNNFTNVTYYKLTISFFSATPLVVSYPPSDNISVLRSEKIINTYVVSVIPSIQYYVLSENSYAAFVYYNIEIIIDYNGVEEIIPEASGTITIHQLQGGVIGGTYNICVDLPTGAVVVPVTAELFYYDYYGGYLFITPYGTGYMWKYYEYDVTLSIEIEVYNGTNPVTVVNGTPYNSRIIHLTTSCTMWSYQSKNYTINVTTYDHVNVANYTIERTWHEVLKINLTPNITINHKPCYKYNVIIWVTNYKYTLNLSVSGLVKPPGWVFKHVPQEEIYRNNYANAFLNGPAYYYSLAESLSAKFSPYQIFEIMHSIQSSLAITNNSWQNLVDVLRYGNGTMPLVYFQIMPLLFLVPYHNFTCVNASTLIGAFNIDLNKTYQTVIIENQTGTLFGATLGSLYRSYYMNVSHILINGTYTFYKWINYSAPPVLFETVETGNYKVVFAG